MKKTKILNVIVIILIIVLIGVMVWNKKKDTSKSEVATSTDSSVMETDNTVSNNNTNSSAIDVNIPTPVDTWKPQSINNEITFNVPDNYYISHPVIGECNDVTSISTQTDNIPAISIALVYKAGCVTNDSVIKSATHQKIKNGYVFQTSSNNPSVIALFDKIVASSHSN